MHPPPSFTGPLLWLLAASLLRSAVMYSKPDAPPLLQPEACHAIDEARVCCAERPPSARPLRPDHTWLLGGPMDLNEADNRALQLLPGIGPARAAAIVETRAAQGAFQGREDLLQVHGIGPATARRLEHHWKPREASAR